MTDPSLIGSPLWLYFLLVAGIVALPGMDMAFVAASSLTGGRRAGFAALGGIVLGGVLHLLLGLFGLGLLISGFPLLFNGLLLAGAAYVAWIGWGLLRSDRAAVASTSSEPLQPVTLQVAPTFLRGLLTCLLNPKAYLFSVTVFPQFLPRDPTRWLAQGLSLGLITALTQIAVYGAVAMAAAHSRRWLAGSTAFTRGVGLLLMSTAAWTLWQGWRGFTGSA